MYIGSTLMLCGAWGLFGGCRYQACHMEDRGKKIISEHMIKGQPCHLASFGEPGQEDEVQVLGKSVNENQN